MAEPTPLSVDECSACQGEDLAHPSHQEVGACRWWLPYLLGIVTGGLLLLLGASIFSFWYAQRVTAYNPVMGF